MRDLRRDGTQIFLAGVDAVRGDRLLRDCVRQDQQHLWLGETSVERSTFDRIVVVGAGKASGAMAVGLVQALTSAPLLSAGGSDTERGSHAALSDPQQAHLPGAKGAGGPEQADLGRRKVTEEDGSEKADRHGGRVPDVAGPQQPNRTLAPRSKPTIWSDVGELEIMGQVNVPEGGDTIPDGLSWPPELTLWAARPAAVNEPTRESIAGTDRILEWVRSAGRRDLIVVLISGGGSALLCQPVAGVTLDEKLSVIRHLSGNGADIVQLNTVRKHLSDVKGGGLARAAGDTRMVTLILSDVLGDPLDLIASGPTVPDRSTSADALAVLAQFDPERQLPAAVYRAITQTRSRSSSARARDLPVIVLGNNEVAVNASGMKAVSLGYKPETHSARGGESFAEQVGEELAKSALELLRPTTTQRGIDALITGGEPVVKLANTSIRGRGGRNQQLVLAAYQWLRERDLTDDEWQRLLILSGGTDGEDGPTDAAGAFVDYEIHDRAIALGLTPEAFLRRNNAYEFFRQTGGLLITGPTGTNVCDVRVALVDRSGKTGG